MLIAACGLDRWVRILDYYSGKLLGKVNMGEMCTAAAFTANGKKLITCTADGCIFLWRMSREISDAI